MPTTVTKTIRASGGDYTTLSGWEAGRQAVNANLVTADVIEVAECYDDWASGLNDALTIDGFTTDSTRYLKVTVASGHRHDGTPDVGFFMYRTADFSAPISVSDDYTVIEHVHCSNTGAGSTAFPVIASNCRIHNVLCGNSNSRFNFYSSSSTNLFTNCLAYAGNTGFTGGDFHGYTLLNCVAAGCSTGFRRPDAGTCIVKNCVAYNNTTNYSGTFDASSTHNATSTGSDDAPGGNSVISIASTDFVDAANNDFHIDSGSALYEAGTDLSSTFTTDIDGDTWATTWSIGFDQPAAGGGETPTLSSPTVTSIGQTTATPQVTVTFA